jgi:2-phosphoglycerate kinase
VLPGNRYVKYFRNIRAIQDYLVKSGGRGVLGRGQVLGQAA